MFFETINTAYIDVESLPWIPFGTYGTNVQLKLIKADPVRGEWIVLLKLPAGSELPMHYHSGTVMVWTFTGKWRYKEHDWVAGPGSFVLETAGSRHTPVNVGDDEVVTLNIVQGDLDVVTPEGALLARENWRTMAERYFDYCRSHGIEPVDVTSFSVT